MRAIDLTDQKFHRLTAIKRENSRWLWKCDCGQLKVISQDKVKSGHTRSCGCLLKEVITKHGHTYVNGRPTRTYRAWVNMCSRVTGFTKNHRKHYTERGIFVCSRWSKSFVNFLHDMGECPLGMTLDRIDNDDGYSPENCRWATPLQQTLNRNKTVWVEIHGERLCLKHACAKLGIVYGTAVGRIQRGMPAQQAVNFALNNKGYSLERRRAISISAKIAWDRRRAKELDL